MKKIIALNLFVCFSVVFSCAYAESKEIKKEEEEKTEVVDVTNVKKEEKKIVSYEEKARNALKNITNDQIENISKIANSTQSANENNIKGTVLSVHIRTFSDIPKSIEKNIISLKNRTRLLIRHIATDIEINRGNSGNLKTDGKGNIIYIKNNSLPKDLSKKRESLFKAKLSNDVSVRSAILAIKLLSSTNDELKNAASKTRNKKQLEQIYLKQAIYIYEMADITLNLLDQLSLEGKSVITSLHVDAKKRVDNRGKEIESQIEKAKKLKNKGLLTDLQFTKEEKSLSLMKKANEQSLDAWGKLMKDIGTQQEFINNLKNKRELISYKRDKAKLQIDTLRDMNEISQFKELIGSLDDLVSMVGDLDLLVLDESTVRVLLGYDIDR